MNTYNLDGPKPRLYDSDWNYYDAVDTWRKSLKHKRKISNVLFVEEDGMTYAQGVVAGKYVITSLVVEKHYSDSGELTSFETSDTIYTVLEEV